MFYSTTLRTGKAAGKSGRCAEESRQAGEEGDWWAGGWRSQAEVTGEKTGNRSKESVTHNGKRDNGDHIGCLALHDGAITTKLSTSRPALLLPRHYLSAPLRFRSPRASFSFSLSLNVFCVPLVALSRPIRNGCGGVRLRKAAEKWAVCGRERTRGRGGRLAGAWLEEPGGGDWRANR